MQTYCRTHQQFEKIIGFNKDNPILACGLTKYRSFQDDKLDVCRSTIDKYLLVQSIEHGIPVDKLRSSFARYLFGLAC